MKQFKAQTSLTKTNGCHLGSRRKPSLSSLVGKENTNVANMNLKHTDRKSFAKDGSPKNSAARGLQHAIIGSLGKQKQYKYENPKLKKSSGSQEKKPSLDNKERSFTPGTIKELMSKARMSSFHYSPKENFKVSFKGKYMRSNSPKNHKHTDFFQDSSRMASSTLYISTSKTRQTESKGKQFRKEHSSEDYQTGNGLQSLIEDDAQAYGDLGSKDKPSDRCTVSYTPRCINHPMKKSRFYLTELEYVTVKTSDSGCLSGVCSKCAVKLASSGRNIEEINTGEDEEKKKKLGCFLQKIGTVRNLVQITEEHIELRETKVISFYEPELETLGSTEIQIHRLFSSFIENVSKLRQLIIGEQREQLLQCKNFKKKLEHKSVELQNLTKYITECQSQDVSWSELITLERNLEVFNQALVTTVDDCKALREIKLSGTKLRGGITTTAQQIQAKLADITKIRPSEIMYQDPNFDKYSQQMAQWLELNRQFSGHMAAESSIDSTSWNEDRNDNSQFVSFEKQDMKNISSPVDDHRPWSSDAQSPSKHFQSILEKIDENQTQKNRFYSKVMTPEDDPLFLVNADRHEFSEKQTPELGIKDQVPEYLKDQFTKLHQQYEQASMQKKQSPSKASEDESLQQNVIDRTKQSVTSHPTTCTESKEQFLFSSSFLNSQFERAAPSTKI